MTMTLNEMRAKKLYVYETVYVRLKNGAEPDDYRAVEFVYKNYVIVEGSYRDDYNRYLIPLDDQGNTLIKIMDDEIAGVFTEAEYHAICQCIAFDQFLLSCAY